MRTILSRAPIAWVAAAAALLIAGWAIGSRLGANDLSAIAPAGSLMEIHLDDGSVYVGSLEPADESWVLTDPAVVLPTSTTGGEASYSVQPLTGDPYGIGGPILIPRERVLFLGGVRAGSGIEAAYRAALAGSGQNPTPSPG